MSDDLLAEDSDPSQQAGVGTLNYDELPGLEDIALEDSFVREVAASSSELRFVLTCALRRTHPFYQRPRSGERHCYRPATLLFPDARTTWVQRTDARFTDADGAVDLGNIDVLVAPPEGGYHIEGDFGVLDVHSRAPVFTVVGASPDKRAYKREALAAWVHGKAPPAPHDDDPDGHTHDHDHDHAHDHQH